MQRSLKFNARHLIGLVFIWLFLLSNVAALSQGAGTAEKDATPAAYSGKLGAAQIGKPAGSASIAVDRVRP